MLKKMLNTLKLGPTGRKQRGVNKRILLLEKLLILEIKSTEKYNKQLLPSKMNKHCHASDFFREYRKVAVPCAFCSILLPSLEDPLALADAAVDPVHAVQLVT